MKNKLIFIIIAAAILTAAFFLQSRGNKEREEFTTETSTEATTEVTTESTTEYITRVTSAIAESTTAVQTTLLQQESTVSAETAVEITTALPLVTTEKPLETTTSKTVSLTVEYGVLKGKLEKADKNNGIVYKGEYTLQGEETAFDVLKNSMRQAGIPMEFTKTPAYDSYYIEGIDNVYEFDFGELSGWLYKVNGEFFGYSSSEYRVKAGDDIVFTYTCNMGRDVGNDFSG